MPYRTPRARPRFCLPGTASASIGDDLVPTAFGYLRLSRSDGRKLTRLRSEVAAYCTSENLALELVLADSGISGLKLVRPGWTALLDLLGRAASGAIVVVPDLSHISEDQMIRAELRTQINEVGAALRVMPAGRGPARRQ